MFYLQIGFSFKLYPLFFVFSQIDIFFKLPPVFHLFSVLGVFTFLRRYLQKLSNLNRYSPLFMRVSGFGVLQIGISFKLSPIFLVFLQIALLFKLMLNIFVIPRSHYFFKLNLLLDIIFTDCISLQTQSTIFCNS